jgi:hypothetical protein
MSPLLLVSAGSGITRITSSAPSGSTGGASRAEGTGVMGGGRRQPLRAVRRFFHDTCRMRRTSPPSPVAAALPMPTGGPPPIQRVGFAPVRKLLPYVWQWTAGA